MDIFDNLEKAFINVGRACGKTMYAFQQLNLSLYLHLRYEFECRRKAHVRRWRRYGI